MFQREALWIDFSGSKECAIKISVGGVLFLERWFSHAEFIIRILGINAITGQPRDEAPPSSKTQDYVVVPHQQWLDGICTASGVVRQVLPLSLPIFQGAVTPNPHVFQFVAMPLGHGYTIEEQITGQAKQGGIQIDVYPLLASAVEFKDEIGSSKDIRMCPRELQISEGRQISMHLK